MSKAQWFSASLLFLSFLPVHGDELNHPGELETSVCGVKEPILFWLWSTTAGRPNSQRVTGIRGIEDISHTTQDERLLRGYRLRADTGTPRGYLLVLQGNAILADQLIGEFRHYARSGYDVYMYDYRGYGRSDGKRRLKAMVSDTREILNQLNQNTYPRHLVYAFSFGGILLLDAYTPELKLDRVVIDSSPSRLSDYGCDQQYDPIVHLPEDSSAFMFIMGQHDSVVTPVMSRELLAEAERRHARVIRDPSFHHPFMDPDILRHQQRMNLIDKFLLE